MAMVFKKSETILDKAHLVYSEHPSPECLDKLIQAATGLIYYFIKLYGAGRSENDLYQVGVEGLLKALKRFQPEVGASFTTFAAHCMAGEIRHYVRKEASFYKPGVIAELQFKIDKAVEQSLKESSKLPTVKEIADTLNIQEDSVREVLRAGIVSFDMIDKAKLSSQHYENFKLPLEDQITLAQAMRKLDKVQIKVIFMLFYKGLTQQQTAEKLGLHQRKVSRIKEKSLEILKQEMT